MGCLEGDVVWELGKSMGSGYMWGEGFGDVVGEVDGGEGEGIVGVGDVELGLVEV